MDSHSTTESQSPMSVPGTWQVDVTASITKRVTVTGLNPTEAVRQAQHAFAHAVGMTPDAAQLQFYAFELSGEDLVFDN